MVPGDGGRDPGRLRPSPDCRLCGLCAGRSTIVLAEGPEDAPLVLIGEAPGEKEDLTGRPFAGRSGKILTRMMEEAGLRREDVLITNAVKCRPPKNRPPTEEEMAACRPFLMSELSRAETIMTLGRSAARDILGREVVMSEEAGRPRPHLLDGRAVTLIPAYHPAATIYSREARESLRRTIKDAASGRGGP